MLTLEEGWKGTVSNMMLEGVCHSAAEWGPQCYQIFAFLHLVMEFQTGGGLEVIQR